MSDNVLIFQSAFGSVPIVRDDNGWNATLDEVIELVDDLAASGGIATTRIRLTPEAFDAVCKESAKSFDEYCAVRQRRIEAAVTLAEFIAAAAGLDGDVSVDDLEAWAKRRGIE